MRAEGRGEGGLSARTCPQGKARAGVGDRSLFHEKDVYEALRCSNSEDPTPFRERMFGQGLEERAP
jgi:hypothetical protein